MKSDAILVGLFSLILGINQCLAPYIYLSIPDQGSRAGRSVTAFFFAPFNLYAPARLIIMRTIAIAGIFGAISYFVSCIVL